MAYEVSDHVLVPNSLVGRGDQTPSALGVYSVTHVGSRGERAKSLQVDVAGVNRWVPRSKVHRNLGIYVVRIGDLSSETLLLDPLAKTLNHYLRLLVDESIFRLVYMRTFDEFTHFWTRHCGGVTHLLILGHGRKDGVKFVGEDGADRWMGSKDFADCFEKAPPKQELHVLSLACSTGYASFAGELSKSPSCADCTAPFLDVHGAIASQFCQSLFLDLLLNGRTWFVAVKHARKSILGTAGFRLWRDGKLKLGSS